MQQCLPRLSRMYKGKTKEGSAFTLLSRKLGRTFELFPGADPA